MPNIGPIENFLVLLVALIVYGPKKLPELGKSLGRGIQEFRGSVSGDNAAPEVEPAETKPADARG